jgi:hypothetical protein
MYLHSNVSLARIYLAFTLIVNPLRTHFKEEAALRGGEGYAAGLRGKVESFADDGDSIFPSAPNCSISGASIALRGSAVPRKLARKFRLHFRTGFARPSKRIPARYLGWTG